MDRKEHFFIIAGGSQQCDFIKRVRERGYITHVFDNNPQCEGRKYADYFYHIDISEKEKILELAQKIKPVAIQAVITEIGNVTACWLGEKLGLRNNTFETALNTTNKSRMKKILSQNGLRTAFSKEVSDEQDILKAGFSYPFLIKAIDSSASRGLSFVENKTQIKPAIELALRFSRQKTVLAEEFIKGREFAVETITDDGKHQIVGITELGTEQPPYVMLSYRLMPARISSQLRADIETFVPVLLDAFHVRHGACHIELFYNEKGIFVVELASRLGGWRDMMMQESIGVNYLDLIIDEALGIPVIMNPISPRYILVRSILNDQDYLRYTYLKEKYPEKFLQEEIKFPYKKFQAKNLMESQGYYCVSANTAQEIEIFIQRYNDGQ